MTGSPRRHETESFDMLNLAAQDRSVQRLRLMFSDARQNLSAAACPPKRVNR